MGYNIKIEGEKAIVSKQELRILMYLAKWKNADSDDIREINDAIKVLEEDTVAKVKGE